MAQAVFAVAESLEVASDKRVYYGSSAGGFQALQVATRDIGSRVLVNNAQIDWTLYMRQSVQAICRHSYPDQSPDEVSRTHPDRTSVPKAFAEFGNVPRTRYLINAASNNDASLQLPALVAGLKTAPASAQPRIDISVYVDPHGGHSPMSKSTTLKEINRMLDEQAVDHD
ncbi:hypothetical protein [Brevibacterium zhoupengii]|uniref:hypothetical protein n=1 Tax=Brevibacterium zhoupengii TaxID=2898795 RepID=UPI001F08B651|nr:hypothetical protein [Brevibacterium zhoupengii]